MVVVVVMVVVATAVVVAAVVVVRSVDEDPLDESTDEGEVPGGDIDMTRVKTFTSAPCQVFKLTTNQTQRNCSL